MSHFRLPRRKQMAKLRRFLKPEDWKRHMRVLNKLAMPKVVARPKRRRPVSDVAPALS